VAGLRREEVAQLAGVSADYYTRLEQGRLPPPSSEVLDSLGRALRLDEDQCAYLWELAARSHEPPATPLPPETVDKQTQILVTNMTTPAMVIGRTMDVLAWNELAAAMFVDFGELRREERNLVRLLFLDGRIRSLYPDWSDTARVAAAMLRMRAARCPHDPRLADLVAELSQHDEDFRRWWAAHQVTTHSRARRTYRHPVVGDLDLEWCELTSSAQPEVRIVVLTPADAKSARQLERLTEVATTKGAEPSPV
jgi:transcriptional regulator with XRE-family HTH domain